MAVDFAGGEISPPDAPVWNPLDPEVHADPYPFFRQVLEFPIHRGQMGFWVVARYDDIATVLRDPRFGHAMSDTAKMLKTMAGPGLITVEEMARWMLFLDPPDHTRLRGLVAKAFTPRSVEAIRPRVQELVDAMVGEMAERLAAGETVDVMRSLAVPLPVIVICELLGLPAELHGAAQGWAEAITQALDPIVTGEQAAAADVAVTALHAALRDVVSERRARPGDDLLSRLIAVQEDGAGGRLTQEELISTVTLLFGAGHETTRNLIGNGLLALLRNPSEMERLRADPSLIRNAMEELLRYDSPVQLTGRIAKEAAWVGTNPVEEGEPVALLMAAGNRDPRQFADPDRLDVGRPDAKPLSFGGGIHYCLGAYLARMEGELAFTALTQRVPRLELVPEALQWRPHITLRGLSALPVSAA